MFLFIFSNLKQKNKSIKNSGNSFKTEFKRFMEVDQADGGDRGDPVQGATLDGDDVQLEAWKMAGNGEVVQAELDRAAV